MEQLSIYLVLLLVGIIVGGVIALSILAPFRTQTNGYYQAPPAYDYASMPARRGMGFGSTFLIGIFVLFLFLGISYLKSQSEQEQKILEPRIEWQQGLER